MIEKLRPFFLSILIIGFSVSIINIFSSKALLFIVTAVLGAYTLLKYRKIDNYILYIILFCTIVQLIAMARFSEFTVHRFLSFAQFITRVLLSYFIIKIGGKNFLNYFERLSFLFILIGLPIFLLSNFYPESISWLSRFDVNSIPIQKEYGGWNLVFYVQSGWAGFRFCGYAYEPGGMAMMIILGLLIYILREGIKLNWNILVYCIALILTFSTTGYIALFLLIIFYFLNQMKRKYLVVNMFFLFLLGFYVIPLVWEQEFMKEKLTEYTRRHQEVVSSEEGYSGVRLKNVGRISAAYIYLSDTFRWPLGHGTTVNGRTKNAKGDLVSGANSVFGFLLAWGIVGFIYYFRVMIRFFKGLGFFHNYKYSWFLVLPFLIVFASNSMLDSPLFYIFPLFSIVYLKKGIFSYLPVNVFTTSEIHYSTLERKF